ncbi:tryptase-like [Physella acuta]|uniref:tryptase-like n=1 Tax=Physella acuta TaxID=109671 RepID=UPI0027DAFA26|nr:tryptase-like [Physella acuta]
MWTFCVVALGLLATVYAQTRACTNHPNGFCINMYTSTCPAGTFMSYSGCGFLENCCYYDSYVAVTTPRPSVSTSSNSCGISTTTGGHKIVGGQATTIDKYPWQVSVRFHGSHICGGTLISDSWVLTAAHCIIDEDQVFTVDEFSIVFGTTHSQNYPYLNTRKLTHILTHSDYVLNDRNDIALMKLDRPVNLADPYVQHICLPSPNEDFSGQVCVATGWGDMHEGDSNVPTPDILREVNLPIISRQVCQYYMGYFSQGLICAGTTQGGVDTCQGDSGGPLMCYRNGVWKIAGIVSHGVGCARPHMYGFYTEVSKFNSWIQSVMSRY